MQQATIGKTIYRVYDSAEDLLAACQRVAEHRVEATVELDWEAFVGRRFTTWAEVYAAVRQAWPEGLQVLERMLDDLSRASVPRPVSRRRKTRFAEDNGDELDYDRLRTGQPFWRTSRRETAQGSSVLTIVVDVGANWKTRHQDILWRGAAAIALTQRLEEAGYRVELWAVQKSSNLYSDEPRGDRWTIAGMNAVCLKRPSDPIDPSTLISLVSGWCFRTVFFRAKCQGRLRIKGSLGRAAVPQAADLDQITTDQRRVLIAGAFSYSGALAIVRGVLAELARQ
jgi:hypothetical protein